MAAVREEICLLAEKEIKDPRPGGICLRHQADFPGPFSRAVRGRHICAGDPLARYKRDGGHAVHSDAAAPYSPVFVLPCACLQINGDAEIFRKDRTQVQIGDAERVVPRWDRAEIPVVVILGGGAGAVLHAGASIDRTVFACKVISPSPFEP